MRKNDQAHIGFESSMSEARMKARMVLWTALLLFSVQVSIYIGIWYFQRAENRTLYFQYAVSTQLIKSNITKNFKFTGVHNGEKYLVTADKLVQLFPEPLKEKMKKENINRFLISFAAYLLIFPILSSYRRKSRKLQKAEHLRGATVITEKQLAKDIKNAGLPTRIKINDNITLPASVETRHFLVAGATGSGKTQLLNRIIKQLKDSGQRLLIYDFKGEFIEYFYDPSKDVIFNPLDTRCVGWNFFNEFDSITEIQSVVASFIPLGKAREPFWIEGARDIFTAVILHCYKTGKITNKGIWETCNLPQAELLEIAKNTCGAEAAIQRLEEPKHAASMLSTMMQYAKSFQILQYIDGDFSFKEWVKSGSGSVFLANNENNSEALTPPLALAIEIVAKQLLSMTGDLDRRVFFFIDEFGSLQQLDSLLILMTVSRGKGGSVWLATQDLNQIARIYDNEAMHSIVNACSTTFTFTLKDRTSAEYFAKAIGESEFRETDNSLSISSNMNRDGQGISSKIRKELVVLPEEIQSLKDLNFYLKIHGFNTAHVKIMRKDFQHINEPFLEVKHFKLKNMLTTTEKENNQDETLIF